MVSILQDIQRIYQTLKVIRYYCLLITVDFQKAVSQNDNVIAYMLVVSERLLEYDIVRNEMK